MNWNRLLVNLALTIPALLLGVVCAVVAFVEPVRILWCEED